MQYYLYNIVRRREPGHSPVTWLLLL